MMRGGCELGDREARSCLLARKGDLVGSVDALLGFTTASGENLKLPGCKCKARQAVRINIAVVDEGRCGWECDARMQGSRKKLQVNPEIEREPRRQTQHARATSAEWKDAEVLQRASWGHGT